MKKTPHILAFLLICTALPIQSQSRLTAKTKVLIGTLVGGGITLILGAYGLKKYRAHKNSSNLLQPLLISDSHLDLALRSENPCEYIQELITGGAVVTDETIDYAQENGTSNEILTLLKRNLISDSTLHQFDEDETKLLIRILSDNSPHQKDSIRLLITQGADPNADIQDPNDREKSISLLDLALRSKNPFENIQALIAGGAVVTEQTIDCAQKKGTSDRILTFLKQNLGRVEFDELWLHKESDFTCDYCVEPATI